MPTLKEQLITILPSVLPKSSVDSIFGTQLVELVRGKLSGNYSDNSIKSHFSMLAKDSTAPIARLDSEFGYFLRARVEQENLAPEVKYPKQVKVKLQKDDASARDLQLEEKFRSIFCRLMSLDQKFPMAVEHTKGKKIAEGSNRWKFPDVIYIEWDVGVETDSGFKFDADMLEVKKSLGEQALRISSVELKVSIPMSELRAYFFQCVSNSKWAHNSFLAIASDVSEELTTSELRRLGNSYGVNVISYGLSREKLMELPDAAKILQMSDSDFEQQIASHTKRNVIASAASRATLDWEHLADIRNQSPDFIQLFNWISTCLAKRVPLRFEELKRFS